MRKWEDSDTYSSAISDVFPCLSGIVVVLLGFKMEIMGEPVWFYTWADQYKYTRTVDWNREDLKIGITH